MVEFTCGDIWTWFYVRRFFFFFFSESITLLVIGFFILSVSSGIGLGRVTFLGFAHFFYVVRLISMLLFLAFSYNPLYFCGVHCNFFFYVSDCIHLPPQLWLSAYQFIFISRTSYKFHSSFFKFLFHLSLYYLYM